MPSPGLVLAHTDGRTRIDSQGRVHLTQNYEAITRLGTHRLVRGYPLHPSWYSWAEHIRGCPVCVRAIEEDEVCDRGLALLNAFYAKTACRWTTRPGAGENQAFWHRAMVSPGLM